MVIKQIKLRGISRTPSDRTTADGGCAESLNVQIDNDEVAPAMAPEDVTGLAQTVSEGDNQLAYKVIFIHKLQTGTDYYLAFDSGKLYAYSGGSSPTEIGTLGDSTLSVTSVDSFGNTVILITSDGKAHYVLYEGGYHYLGTEVPEPKINFKVLRKDPSGEVITVHLATAPVSVPSDPSEAAVREVSILSNWNNLLPRNPEGMSEADLAAYSKIQEMNAAFWFDVDKRIINNLDSGYFSIPVLARYAVRMYDDRYVHISAPVYLGAGATTMLEAYASKVQSNNDYVTTADVTFNTVYSAKAYLSGDLASSQVWEKWDAFIKSIDIFISPYITVPDMYAKFSGLGINAGGTGSHKLLFKDEVALQGKIENVSSFYKIASFNKNQLTAITNVSTGYDLLTKKEMGRQENLVLKETLKNDYAPEYLPKHLRIYNSRLVMGGADKIISRGQHFQFAQSGGAADTGSYGQYAVAYRIKADDGEEHIVRENANGDALSSYVIGDPAAVSRSYGVVFHPDPNCIEAMFFDNNGHYFLLPMTSHPFLNCSFGYIGADVTIPSKITESWSGTITENRVAHMWNKLLLTENESIFSIDAASAISFRDTIIDVAPATKPLSTGQYGQHPVMVFTEGGIFGVGVGSDGSFGKADLVSREIANAGTITQLDQAIVFCTDKGVMLLSGSDVAELSASMKGRPSPLSSALIPTFTGDDIQKWGRLFTSVINSEPTFTTFMQNVKIAYDYKGGRLLFFNNGYKYVFVYVLASATWHKMEGAKDVVNTGQAITILNSYPECYVCQEVSTGGVFKLLNYSVLPSDATVTSDTLSPTAGVILTRPFDLDAPDVRKAIRSLRIRGKHNKGDVKYVLYGSMDGYTWQQLTSLRSGSYKLFRLLILTNLTASERISWVDIDYETRFTDKLR